MSQAEIETWEDDGELAAFEEEMRRDEPLLRAILLKRAIETGKPYPVEVDYHMLRHLVKDYNKMAAILREFVSRHPEDADLAHRAKRYL